MIRNLLGRLYDPCLKKKLIPPRHWALSKVNIRTLSVHLFIRLCSFDYVTLTNTQTFSLSLKQCRKTVINSESSMEKPDPSPVCCDSTWGVIPVIVLMKVYSILVYHTHIQVYGHGYKQNLKCLYKFMRKMNCFN